MKLYRYFTIMFVWAALVFWVPAQVLSLDCSGAINLGCISSTTVTGDTTGGTSSVSTYSCVTWPEDGPEDVYIISPDGTGNIDVCGTSR